MLNTISMKKIFFLLLYSATGFFATAQTWQDTLASIDKLFERFKPGNPGIQIAISRNGQIIFSKAWGMADLEHGAPLTTESIIEAGSVSKQFTAAAILLLEQQGKLSLNDDVRKFLPEIPDYGNVITLRHMMQHTSGLKDWGSIAAMSGWPRTTKTYNNDDALYIVTRQKTLNNKPGDEYIYSNSNYNLLAIIVQRVGGKSLAEFTRQFIFEPAGMKHTSWRDNYKRIVRGRAIAYSKAGNNYFTEMPNEYVYGNGGLLTTAEDLLAWNYYYLSGKFGSPSLLSKQLALSPFNNGKTHNYAAGLVIDSANGWKQISHSGATAGYRANLEHFPELGLSFAILSNTSEIDRGPSPISQIRNLFVPDKRAGGGTPTTIAEHKVSDQLLNSYQGWYYSPLTGVCIKLYVRNGKLHTNRSGALVPLSDNLFQMGTNRVQLSSKLPRHLLFIAPADSIYFAAVDSGRTDEKYLEEYTGKYYSEEAESYCEIKFKNAALVFHRDPATDIPLLTTYKDGFDSYIGNMHFERNKAGKITGFKVSVTRARNVVFKKTN